MCRPAATGTLCTMTSSLSHLFAAAEEHTRELPMSPYAFGALAMLCFLALLGILWSFRGAAAKLAGPDHGAPEHQGGHH